MCRGLVAIKMIKRERLHSEDNFQEELKVARRLGPSKRCSVSPRFSHRFEPF